MRFTILVFAAALFSGSALASTFQAEAAGTCVFHAAGNSGILHKTDVRFEFPEIQSTRFLTGGNEHELFFGIGTTDVKTQIDMMDVNRNIISKPVRITLTVTISPDGKRKQLSGSLNMYNIYKGRQETITLEDSSSLDKPVSEDFSYFQRGFYRPDNELLDRITTSSAFCHFDDRKLIAN